MPDGNPILPNDKTKLPKGNLTLPNDKIKMPDGNLILPNDKTKMPNGNLTLLNDKTKMPDGNPILPNDKTKLPDGNLTLPNGKTKLQDDNLTLPNGYRSLEISNWLSPEAECMTARDWKTAEMSSQAFPCGFLVLRCISTIADAAEMIVKPRILANTPTPRRAGSLARTQDWGGLATTSAKHLENAESQKRPEDRTGISKLRTKNEEPRTSNQRLRRMSDDAPPNLPEEDDETALMPLRELEGAEKLATPGLMRSARPLGRGCDGAM